MSIGDSHGGSGGGPVAEAFGLFTTDRLLSPGPRPTKDSGYRLLEDAQAEQSNADRRTTRQVGVPLNHRQEMLGASNQAEIG